jgi:hypothetical protein
MSQPRKQHFLPQFYLRGFSLDGRGIHQIEKQNGKHYGCQIKDIAAVKDFHVLDHAGVEDPYALEKRLSELEGELAKHLSAFLADGVENENARIYTVKLLSLMRLRVRAYKKYIESSYPSAIRRVAEFMERDGMLPTAPQGLEEKLRVKNLKINILNWKTMEIIFNLAASKDILPILYGMRCTVYAAPPGTSFVTSDQPVAFFHPSAFETSYGIGPSALGVEITLPLSARKLLRLDHSPLAHSSRVASFAQMLEFNRRTIAMARKYIFAASNPQNYLEVAANTRDIRAGFVFEDLDDGDGWVQIHRYIALGPEKRGSHDAELIERIVVGLWPPSPAK